MKTKIKFLKAQTAIIMLLLSVLGFSCKKEDRKCDCPTNCKPECECAQSAILKYGIPPPRCFTLTENDGKLVIEETEPISEDESN